MQERGTVHVHRKKKNPLQLTVLTLDNLRELNKFTLAKIAGKDIDCQVARTVSVRGRVKKNDK